MANVRNTAAVLLGSLAMFVMVGCAAERHKDIPESARLVADGHGDVDFVAPNDGMVYVYDRGAGDLIYSGRILESERVEVEPMKDRITLNGRTVMDKQIRDNNEIRVFFRGQPRPANVDTASSRTTVIQQQQPVKSSDTEIVVQPSQNNDGAVRVKPGTNSDSKITVEPGDEGSKVIIEGQK